MSQNGPYSGPPFSGGSNDEPYSEPADPWGDSAAAVPNDPSWGGHPPSIPQQAVYNSGSMSNWGQPAAPPPPRRNTGILALVVVLGLLIVAGLGTTGWLLKQRRDRQDASAQASASASAAANPSSVSSDEDARFVAQGQCVTNRGTNDEPAMRKSACASGTYLVLRVFKGKTSGEKDAESKCAKVAGYTNWYFYDSEFDDLDFVLCLKRQ